MQLDKRISHQAELVGHRLEFAEIARRQRRPGFLGRHNALARLGKQRRVKAAKLHRLVIHRFEAGQAVSGTHNRKNGRIGSAWRNRLAAEKKQILRQAIRRIGFAFGQGGVLQQHPGCGTFDV